MKLNASKIKKILVISLSNIGDVILTFPVIDILKRDFASAEVSVVVGAKAASLFKHNPYIAEVFIYEKHKPPFKQLKWLLELRKNNFDLVIDLRNTAIPLFLSPKYRTPLSSGGVKKIHMKEKHLNRLKNVWDFKDLSQKHYALYIGGSDKQYIDDMLKNHIEANKRFIVVGPGAANHIKRWTEEGFAKLCDELIEDYKLKIIFVGDENDKDVVSSIINKMQKHAINWVCKTTLIQLGELVSRSWSVIANDSAIMHMASYLNVPTLAIFGPTDEAKYGPWGFQGAVIRKKDLFCAPCQKSGCAYKHECMQQLTVEEVRSVFDKIFQNVNPPHPVLNNL